VHFINDIYFIPPRGGCKQNFILNLPNIVYRGVGSAINLDNIQGRSLGDFPALGAFPTGCGGRAFFTV
jgi:hypothetical protein